MKKIIAFADEFGNNSFDFSSQGSHFIVTSVIMNLDELEENNKKLEAIRKKHFQTGEIKSSKVSKNHSRRKRILRELNTLNFSIYSVVVDKKKLFVLLGFSSTSYIKESIEANYLVNNRTETRTQDYIGNNIIRYELIQKEVRIKF